MSSSMPPGSKIARWQLHRCSRRMPRRQKESCLTTSLRIRRNRLADVRHALTARGVIITDSDILLYDRFEPGDFEARLLASLQGYSARRVILDVSTMSKLAIMLALNVCRALDVNVLITYSEANKIRSLAKASLRTQRRTRRSVSPASRSSLGSMASSELTPSPVSQCRDNRRPRSCFMSFNDTFTQVLLNTVYPSRLLLINGRPPAHRWREEAMAWIHDQVRREWENDNPLASSDSGTPRLPKRVVSTLDYRETVDLFIKLVLAVICRSSNLASTRRE